MQLCCITSPKRPRKANKHSSKNANLTLRNIRNFHNGISKKLDQSSAPANITISHVGHFDGSSTFIPEWWFQSNSNHSGDCDCLVYSDFLEFCQRLWRFAKRN